MLNKKALAGTPSTPPAFVEDVFSTYLYTGTGANQTITNDIDLAGKGGMVWIKSRTSIPSSTAHMIADTVRGPTVTISSDTDSGNEADTDRYQSFNNNGFSIKTSARLNYSANPYVSWTFRKQAKFFDVVTYTGNGSGSGQTINHNLGSVPGCIIVKRTDTTGNWAVYHRSLTSANYSLLLNLTGAQDLTDYFLSTPTSTTFQVGSNSVVNASGGTYVAYLFAHNAGGFGTGTDNVISCGSYTGSGGSDQDVSLGFEPQMMIVKCSSEAKTDGWIMVDTMRGMDNSANAWLFANTTAAESAESPRIIPTATGFRLRSGAVSVNDSGKTFIYIAIRRGPMKTPTSGTSVFEAKLHTGTGANATLTGGSFPPDLFLSANRDTIRNRSAHDRLRGIGLLNPNLTNNEETSPANSLTSFNMTGISVGTDATNQTINNSGKTYAHYYFGRAPGFFDEVCYTGTGSTTTITHNLGVTPELVITKSRSQALGWVVWTTSLTSTSYWIRLDDTMAQANSPVGYGGTFSASNYTIANTGPYNALNNAGSTYVAYLFATVAGVSKVGSYTGTGTTQTINCGFTAGARFVLIKRTDSTGDWYVWDTARNIISGNDPYLLLNSTAAEVTNTDYIDPVNSGFELSSTAPAAINANGGSFIFMAIA